MATNRALAENNQRARENVGALYRDRNRDRLIGATDIVVRPEANALATLNIHRIVQHQAHAFGHVVFRNRRDHRRFLAHVECTRCHRAAGIHQIGVAADTGQWFFDAFESADRGLELAAHARVGTGHHARGLAGRDRCCRQRNRTARGETLHQHAPALPDHGLTADDPVDWDEYILAGIGAIHERRVQRKVTAADIDALVRGRNECAGNAQVSLSAEQFIRVETLECKAQNRRDWAERDVAFFPSNAQSQRFLAFPHLFADDAHIRHRRGIRACVRCGQREARNLQAFRQARQVVIFLVRRAVVQQQFAGAE